MPSRRSMRLGVTTGRRARAAVGRWRRAKRRVLHTAIHGALPPHPTLTDRNSFRRFRPRSRRTPPNLKYECFALVPRTAEAVKRKIRKTPRESARCIPSRVARSNSLGRAGRSNHGQAPSRAAGLRLTVPPTLNCHFYWDAPESPGSSKYRRASRRRYPARPSLVQSQKSRKRRRQRELRSE